MKESAILSILIPIKELEELICYIAGRINNENGLYLQSNRFKKRTHPAILLKHKDMFQIQEKGSKDIVLKQRVPNQIKISIKKCVLSNDDNNGNKTYIFLNRT